MSEAYYHEDDFCQIELVPFENQAFVENQIKTINGFSEEHQAPSGVGWTEMYMQDEPNVPLRDKGIRVEQFERQILQEIPKFSEVYTGYSTHRELCKNTNAYGNEVVKIFVSYKDEIIQNIWFGYCLTSIAVAETVHNYLTTITRKFDLLFVDWAWGFSSRPNIDLGLKAHLVGIATEIMESNKQKSQESRETRKWWKFWN